MKLLYLYINFFFKSLQFHKKYHSFKFKVNDIWRFRAIGLHLHVGGSASPVAFCFARKHITVPKATDLLYGISAASNGAFTSEEA